MTRETWRVKWIFVRGRRKWLGRTTGARRGSSRQVRWWCWDVHRKGHALELDGPSVSTSPVGASNYNWKFQAARLADDVATGDYNTRHNAALTMKSSAPLSLVGAFRSLTISAPSTARPSLRPCLATASRQLPLLRDVRPFSVTAARAGNWLEPNKDRKTKMMKGRPRVATGGSTKGTTVVWGDYGLRMIDHHRRISAHQLQVAENAIKQRLRGEKYRLYKRVHCSVGVFVSGNEVRLRAE